MQTDRGVTLTREQHLQVAELAGELSKYCVDSPVKCPLIFGGTLLFVDEDEEKGI